MMTALERLEANDQAEREYLIMESRAIGEAMGKKIGEAMGKKESKIEIAENLIKMKVDFKIISSGTGLSLSDLHKLKEKIDKNSNKI